MSDAKLAAFKKDLQALLAKHNASIEVGFSDCSDTHGMSDQHMFVFLRADNGRTASHRISNVWGVDANDLKE